MGQDETRFLLEIILYATSENSTLIEISRKEYETNGSNLFDIIPISFLKDNVSLSLDIKVKARRVYTPIGQGMVKLLLEEKL